MSSSSASPRPAPFDARHRTDRLADALLRPFLRDATVRSVERMSTGFRDVVLAGDGLKDAAWVPGQKTQVVFGGFRSRTYTPICWDAAEGRTRLIGYVHGDGPGSDWLDGLRVGDALSLLGPRRSLDLADAGPQTFVFGDETSFALAAAARGSPALDAGSGRPRSGLRGDHCLFEVTAVDESRRVLAQLGIEGAMLVERLPGDAHLDTLLSTASGLLARSAIRDCVLTGKSTSIQRLLRHLKRSGMASANIRTKAYWAPGKTGLD